MLRSEAIETDLYVRTFLELFRLFEGYTLFKFLLLNISSKLTNNQTKCINRSKAFDDTPNIFIQNKIVEFFIYLNV